MRFLWVGLGGAIGSILRYAVGLGVDQSRFPWGTLAVNLSGSFALGFLLTWASGRWPVNVTVPLAVGLLGGFTTFSTFSWESLTLFQGGRPGVAAGYLMVTVIGGIGAALGGYALAAAVR